MTEDYIDETTGLLFCGKCRTPKEARLPGLRKLLGTETVSVLCRCQQESRDREDREAQERQRCEHLRTLRREAFREIPGADWQFSSARMTGALEKVKRYAGCWEQMEQEGMGLLLFGGVGTGKSYAAGCLANALLDRGHSVRFVSLSDVVNRMQGTCGADRETFLLGLLKPELLILDDLGAERSTSFGREQVFDVINRRTLSKRPLVVTTNLPLKVLEQAESLQDKRIYDRVLEACVPIAFTGESFRKERAAENLRRAAQMLGG